MTGARCNVEARRRGSLACVDDRHFDAGKEIVYFSLF